MKLMQPVLARPSERIAVPLTYVLVTPARNEAAFIELTLRSVIAQTVRPLKWVIVSDGSTDGTDEIVQTYASRHSWIELMRMPERKERHFAGKAYAFNQGFRRFSNLHYDVVGNLDADISFDKGYFEFLLKQFESNSRLGVAGTPFYEGEQAYDYRFVSIKHVSGACQLFRKDCFDQVGGYIPLKAGGVDHVAVLTARMKGWETRTFIDKICIHHRPQGSAIRNLFRIKVHDGRLDYELGGHPLWQLFRGTYQMTKRPFIIGGALILAGYFGAMFRRRPKTIPPELMSFRRREQMQRLRSFFKRVIGSSAARLVQ